MGCLPWLAAGNSRVYSEKATTIVERIPAWGRRLRHSLVGKAEVEPGTGLRISAKADTAGLALVAQPWELIGELGAETSVEIWETRRSFKGIGHDRVELNTPLRILVVSPRPEELSERDYRADASPIVEAVLEDEAGGAVVHVLPDGTLHALKQALAQGREAGHPYQVVHFDGFAKNGDDGPELLFELSTADSWGTDKYSADQIADFMAHQQTPLMVVNPGRGISWHPLAAARLAKKLLAARCESVVIWGHSPPPEVSTWFTAGFYRALIGARTSITEAVTAGRKALLDAIDGSPEENERLGPLLLAPMLFQATTDRPLVVGDGGAFQARQIRKAIELLPPSNTDSFIGRRKELLNVQRQLLRDPCVLVRGIRGQGITSFLRESARWLIATESWRAVLWLDFGREGEKNRGLDLLNRAWQRYLDRGGREVAPRAQRGLNGFFEFIRQHDVLVVIDEMNPSSDLIWTTHTGRSRMINSELDELITKFEQAAKTSRSRLIVATHDSLPSVGSPLIEFWLPGLTLEDAASLVNSRQRQSVPRLDERDKGFSLIWASCLGNAQMLVDYAESGVDSGTNYEETDRIIEMLTGRASRRLAEPLKHILESTRPTPELIELLAGTARTSGPTMELLLGGSASSKALAENPTIDALTRAGLAQPDAETGVSFHPALPATLRQIRDNLEFPGGTPKRTLSSVLRSLPASLMLVGLDNPAVVEPIFRIEQQNLMGLLREDRASSDPRARLDFAWQLEVLSHAACPVDDLADVGETLRDELLETDSSGEALCFSIGVTAGNAIRLGAPEKALEDLDAALNSLTVWRLDDEAHAQLMYRTLRAEALRANEQPGQALADLDRMFQTIDKKAEEDKNPALVRAAYAIRQDCLRDLGLHEDYRRGYHPPKSASNALDAALQVRAGNAACLSGHYNDAWNLYKSAKAFYQKARDGRNLALVLHQLGILFRAAGRFGAAEDHLDRALAIRLRLGEVPAQVATGGEMGNLAAVTGYVDQAVALYQGALDLIPNDRQLQPMEYRISINLARVLMLTGAVGEAEESLRHAEILAASWENNAETWKLHGLRGELYRLMDSHEAALEAERQAVEALVAARDSGLTSRSPHSELIRAAVEANQVGADRRFRFLQLLNRKTHPPETPESLKRLVPVLQDYLSGGDDFDAALLYEHEVAVEDAAELRWQQLASRMKG